MSSSKQSEGRANWDRRNCEPTSVALTGNKGGENGDNNRSYLTVKYGNETSLVADKSYNASNPCNLLDPMDRITENGSTTWTIQLGPYAENNRYLPLTKIFKLQLKKNASQVPGTVNSIKILASPEWLHKLIELDSNAFNDLNDLQEVVINGIQINSSEVPIFPSTVTSLTFTNCELDSLYTTTNQLPKLAALNVSTNNLIRIWSILDLPSLTTIDLSNNGFTSIPHSLLGLQNINKIYLSNNPISNWTLPTMEMANKIQTLNAFRIDQNSDINCSSSQTKYSVKTTNDGSTFFCIPRDGSVSIPIYAIVLITVGIFILLLIIVRLVLKRKSNTSNMVSTVNKSTSSGYSDCPSENETIHSGVWHELNYLAFRIPYKEIQFSKIISHGGFGEIWVGTYCKEIVAIKRLLPDFRDDMNHIREFINEIKLMAQLRHVCIVEFKGMGYHAFRDICAVTEYMALGDLRSVLKVLHSKGKSGAKKNLRNNSIRDLTWVNGKYQIALDVINAIVYLHSLIPKVIHRDLKSRNILLSADVHAKLSDFGISRRRTFEETMTAGVGTTFWMAPEILLGRDYSENVDIYSFGIVLSELDTNEFPYTNSATPNGCKLEDAAKLQLIASGKITPYFAPACPPELKELAMECLQFDPELRPDAISVSYSLQKIKSKYENI